MASKVVTAAALVALGAAAGAVIASRPPAEHAPPPATLSPPSAVVAAPGFAARPAPVAGELAQEIARLAERVSEEAAARRRLEERLEAVHAQLAAHPGGASNEASASAADPSTAPTAVAALGAPAAPPADAGLSPTEKALIAAGIPAGVAADIKRKDDGLAMAEMVLRDQATRENWLETPRFATEMASIHQQRVPVRDAVGDDAYDRYLFALGSTNRIRVDDVMIDSPAALAGVQSGDLVLRYNGTRVFEPRELIEQTHGGNAGEVVRLEIKRAGQILEVEVPRGPLGLRINAAQDAPT